MAPHIDRDTTLCISLSARPSNHGVRFHNWLYEQLGLNYVYQPFAPADLVAAVAGIRGLKIRGSGVSMPYKTDVIPLLDELHPSAERIDAVNTIVNDDGVLTGYNTDVVAVASLLEQHRVDPTLSVAMRGSGGMANAVIGALADHGMNGTVVARNHMTGAALSQRHQWNYSAEVPPDTQVLVNVTPLGMEGPDQDVQSFSDDEIAAATLIIDVVANPVRTPLIAKAEALDKPVITGRDIIALQAAEQFALYTGVRPDPALVEAAEEQAN